MGWVFVAVFAVSWAFAALVFWISVTGTQRVQRRQARLLAQTSVFWSRWPGDRFWAAPYGELVAQAERYEQLIGILGQRKTLATPRFPSKQDRLFLDYLDGQLDDSRVIWQPSAAQCITPSRRGEDRNRRRRLVGGDAARRDYWRWSMRRVVRLKR